MIIDGELGQLGLCQSQKKYLTSIGVLKYKIAMAQFRCSTHDLCIEVGRRNNIAPEERYCILCLNIGEALVEDEYHFVMKCIKLEELRSLYIPKYYTQYPTAESFVSLYQSENKNVIVNLAKFIYHGLQYRRKLLSNM